MVTVIIVRVSYSLERKTKIVYIAYNIIYWKSSHNFINALTQRLLFRLILNSLNSPNRSTNHFAHKPLGILSTRLNYKREKKKNSLAKLCAPLFWIVMVARMSTLTNFTSRCISTYNNVCALLVQKITYKNTTLYYYRLLFISIDDSWTIRGCFTDDEDWYLCRKTVAFSPDAKYTVVIVIGRCIKRWYENSKGEKARGRPKSGMGWRVCK